MGVIVDKKGEHSCLFIGLGIFFLAISLLTFFLSLLPALYDTVRMQNWESVEGELTINKNKLSYRYYVDGKPFKNNRIDIFKDSGVEEDFIWSHIGGSPRIKLWYDKENPIDAIIDRNISWGHFSILLIVSLALVFLAYGLVNIRIVPRNNSSPADYDEKPWVYDFPNNVDGVFKSNSESRMWLFGFAGGVANLMTLPMGAILFSDFEALWINSKPLFFLIVFLFLFGLVVLYAIYLNTKEWLYFGKTPLKIDPFPASLGGSLSGEISITKHFEKNNFKVTLYCVSPHKVKSVIGGSRHGKFTSKTTNVHEKILWHDEVYAKKKVALNGIKLKFLFYIPKNLPESGRSSVDNDHWRLDIESEGDSSIILNRNFIVPVYDVARYSHPHTFTK